MAKEGQDHEDQGALGNSKSQIEYDGINFDSIGVEVGTSHSDKEVRNYVYADIPEEHGQVYYQIRQSDIGGAHAHTDVIVVNIDSTATAFGVSSIEGMIVVHVSDDEWKHIRIMDTHGKMVLETQADAHSGDVEISTHDFEPGIYILLMETPHEVLTKKVRIF